MPVPAKRAQICRSSSLHASNGGRVERIALRAITTFADAHAAAFLAIRPFHAAPPFATCCFMNVNV
jgi:hypothetical protein